MYMPVSLLLRAEEALWTLPATELPAHLPIGMDRRGLFQLRPQVDYLRVKAGDEHFSVRRMNFLTSPADTFTVYAAQGGTYDAVIADMQRPPNLRLDKHWLACYVMLSRARSIEGFLVLRPATRAELSARPPQYLLDELARLERLEDASLPELLEYIENLDCDVAPQIRALLDVDAAQREAEIVAAARQRKHTPTPNQTPTHRLRSKTRMEPIVLSEPESSAKRARFTHSFAGSDRSYDVPLNSAASSESATLVGLPASAATSSPAGQGDTAVAAAVLACGVALLGAASLSQRTTNTPDRFEQDPVVSNEDPVVTSLPESLGDVVVSPREGTSVFIAPSVRRIQRPAADWSRPPAGTKDAGWKPSKPLLAWRNRRKREVEWLWRRGTWNVALSLPRPLW